ncbi:MAG: hypothetical protein DMF67_19425 [Acidobacteria bacterium]|nr:MAG: hypothetical protein DMF66_13755 [Acidobacteriota bacterium]PYS80727.1 MAG: hypothetical protein DMF67_19425 [Acidobacteriota bacterium]
MRQLKPGAGVTESSVEVSSLEQLFDQCLSLVEQQLLERFVVAGLDARGRRRSLTFTFQSASERD